MQVEVSNLTKKYGDQLAVNNLSFSSQGNEIIGFLGPNGAGKSTTMKMLTGYLSLTSGSAKLVGYDVVSESERVKSLIGYLPESNPLYYDMYVREFLLFVAKTHRLPKLKDRVEEVIEEVGLEREAHKIIRQLSKGYRQRVGLAQAIIHDPQVLILDEPTSGLDANQLLDVRGLIRKLGKDKTILFSSHIMQEVEALCNRILIIDNGKLLVDSKIDHLASLVRGDQKVVVEFLSRPHNISEYLSMGKKVMLSEDHRVLSIIQSNQEDLRPEIFRKAVVNNDIIIGMYKENQSVETIFQKLTNKS